MLNTVFDAIKQTQADDVAEAIRQALEAVLESLPEADRETATRIRETLRGQQDLARSPWFRFFLAYDPYPTLTRVSCPVLAVNGENDVQVLAGLNLPTIEKALREGKNEDVEIVALEGLNHLFQASETGALSEYASIQETINPRALETIGDWIIEHTLAKD